MPESRVSEETQKKLNGFSTTGLPVIPWTMTTTIEGVKYEMHVLTNTCQVVTEDGVMLCDILKKLATKDEIKNIGDTLAKENRYFKLKGVLNNLPDLSAINQLYAKTGNVTGEVYLVETNVYGDPKKVYDMYVYDATIATWVWCGSTSKASAGGLSTADIEFIKMFPTTPGKPGQYLLMNDKGDGLIWGFGPTGSGSTHASVDWHNLDPEAHADIRRELGLKADKLIIFDDVLKQDDWVWDGEGAYYTLCYRNKNFSPRAYFELTPAYDTSAEMKMIAAAGIFPSYRIRESSEGAYALLHASSVPKGNIKLSVKLWGDYEDGQDTEIDTSDPGPTTPTPPEIGEVEVTPGPDDW
ncbi:MAG: hypothetical protein NC548_05850 [Lachnospiraceae bacterium]|nr:hypothetical protein [Lachnospiraceae bacterium]